MTWSVFKMFWNKKKGTFGKRYSQKICISDSGSRISNCFQQNPQSKFFRKNFEILSFSCKSWQKGLLRAIFPFERNLQTRPFSKTISKGKTTLFDNFKKTCVDDFVSRNFKFSLTKICSRILFLQKYWVLY